MNKVLITSAILFVLIPAIGVTAQELMSKEEYLKSVFNKELLLFFIWDSVILAISIGYKTVKYLRED